LIIDRYRQIGISKDYYGDSIANSVVDLLACLIGYAITVRVRMATSIVLFALIELVLLFTIRDGLILNIIMLIYPIPAIEQWQAAG
jgi:hypothetical protein